MKLAYSPPEILEAVVEKGVAKARTRLGRLLLLAFMGGLYVSMGYITYLRICASFPHELAGLASFLGACLFPVGLMGVLLAGGELITGNMLVVAAAAFARRIRPGELARNWAVVTLGNLLGGLFAALVLARFAGLLEGAMLEKVLAAADGKAAASFLEAFFSGIGCNLFVGLAVWMQFGAADFSGKTLAMWFPVTAFVCVGFQHVVANLFLLPAAIFSGASSLSWLDVLGNALPVWLGNGVGGALLMGGVYCLVYGKRARSTSQVS